MVERKTRETEVRVSWNGVEAGLALPVPLFQHFLDACLTTWGEGWRVDGRGDVDVDPHHLVEDVGLVLGRAMRERWPEYRNLSRYGWAVVAMDDARAAVALDLSGRSASVPTGVPDGPVAGLDSEVLTEFFHGLARGGDLTVHLTIEAGVNRHHQWEAGFKALGLALRMATAPRDGVLSTKGVIGDGGGDCGPGGR